MSAVWEFISNSFETITTLLNNLGPVFVLLSGIFTLFFGRKLFWVFVGVLGFMAGYALSDFPLAWLPDSFAEYGEALSLGVALLTAIIAIAVHRLGAVVAGVAAFALAAYGLAGRYELSTVLTWSATVGAVILGALLLIFYYDWTLILTTSFLGAGVTVMGLDTLQALPESTGPWLFLLLFAVGVVYQRKDGPYAGGSGLRKARSQGKSAAELPDSELQPLEAPAARSLNRSAASPTIGIPSYANSPYANPNLLNGSAQNGKQEPKQAKPAYEVYG